MIIMDEEKSKQKTMKTEDHDGILIYPGLKLWWKIKRKRTNEN